MILRTFVAPYGTNALHPALKLLPELYPLLFMGQMPNEPWVHALSIICEAVSLGTLEISGLIVCGLSDTRESKRGQDIEWAASHAMEEHVILLQRTTCCLFILKLLLSKSCGYFVRGLKHCMLLPPFIFISIQCFSAMRYTPSPSNAGMKLSSAVSPS